MSTEALPIILSLPHGGLSVPPDLKSRLIITETDIFNECDLWIDDLFGFETIARVTTPYSRALIDVNRAANGLANPDGPVKTRTSYGHSIYEQPPTRREKERLIESYWRPYTRQLQEALESFGSQVRLFLDCHSMAQTSPDAYVDAGEPRPLICLANSGNRRGAKNSSRGNISCSAEYIRHAATIAEEVFAGITLIEPQPGPQPSLVSINDPFPGGYILKEYAKERDQRGYPPGMMIEFNRGLYVGNQGAHTPISQPNEQRIADLRERTYIWLERLVGEA